MNRLGWIGSTLLIVAIVGAGVGLAAWKRAGIAELARAAANQPELVETVTTAVASKHEHRPTTSSIGTVMALRSISLRNEVSGTVRQVALTPGQIVDTGTVLVALDVSVENAELQARQAQAALAQVTFDRLRQLREKGAVSAGDMDRARAERDVALAEIARTRAIIARKTIRAPFRARIGLADVHPGQFLEEGALLTTLQGVDDSLHVDFAVPQQVAAALKAGSSVEVLSADGARSTAGKIVAVDARVDPATRNATVRAKILATADAPSPGASVRVLVPAGQPQPAVAVPANALRKGPAGDHVFVLAQDKAGKTRAQLRPIQVGTLLENEVIVLVGLTAGEQVVTSGSFKLSDATLVAIAPEQATAPATK